MFIFSIGAVSSQDANQTADLDIGTDVELESENPDLVSASTGTFIDLNTSISQSSEKMDISQDYAYDSEKDKNLSSIEITNKNLSINGNNHIIDGNGLTRIFTIDSSNVVINNLIIKNANQSAIFIQNSTLKTYNVTFENNIAKGGGAICGVSSIYNSSGDRFINNYAKVGSSIYLEDISELYLNDGTFKNDDYFDWSLIYLNSCTVDIQNTSFYNLTSNYCPAVYIGECEGRIKNSKFVNLHANKTAGAVALKKIYKEFSIEDCEFINATSEKNGGAIYSDVNGDGDLPRGNLNIVNSRFEDCSSEFGGAVLHLGGLLNINNTNFTSNIADYDGGAVYTSNSYVSIYNSSFILNKALTNGFSNGGAIFNDKGSLELIGCTFKNNVASNASSIYSYESELTLNECYFNNPNVNSTSICMVFGRGYSQNGTDLNNDVLSLNNTYFDTNVKSSQKPYVIINNTINYDKLPERFDLRDYNWVSPVKKQGNMGACWAFGNVAALESSLMRYLNITYDFSENNLQNSMLKYSKYGVSTITEGGDLYTAVGYLISWLGISPTEYDSYDELGKISPIISSSKDVHILDAVFVPARNNVTDNYLIKKAIIDYGALAVSCFAVEDGIYFNTNTSAQYINESSTENHKVCVVGWDDNYSKDNFAITPPGDGAWIIKNSWGSEWGDKGYFYISYFDGSFASKKELTGYVIKNDVNYDMVYQHDIGGDLVLLDAKYYMNKYIAEEDGLIAAVGTYFDSSNLNYEFSVFVNDVEVYNHKGASEFRGYSTIPLNKYIKIKKGDTFKVIFKNKAPALTDGRTPIDKNVTFQSDDGKTWDDLSDTHRVAVLKVYTIPDLNIADDLVKYYGDDTPYTANVQPGDKVTFEINGITATVIVDENGTAKLGVDLKPGTYYIKVNYNGTKYPFSVIIKSTIASQDVTRGYNSNYDYQIQLFDKKGNALNNTAVSVTVNDKTGKYTTDGNGFVTIEFTKLTTNQKISIVNPSTSETSANTIKVVSRFSGNSNVNMYYFDGSSYKFKVYGDDGKLVGANKVVSVKLNKITYKVKTNNKGVASLKIPNTVNPGTYTITATYAGQTVKNTVKVKQVLKTAKKTVKKSDKKLVLKAMLKNQLKGKVINFKFNGKTYKAKTNKKGIAQVTIKKNVINKLKKGKTYAFKVTYVKDSIKSTVKIK